MRKWKISEAKAKFTELLMSCENGPQIICNREKPVSAVMSMKLFKELMELRKVRETPTIAQLLTELESIKKIEPDEIEIPMRQNRTTPVFSRD